MSERQMTDGAAILARNIAAVNARDIEGYLANQHPDIEFVLPGGVVLHGRDEVRRATEALWTAFPDGHLLFGDQVVSGDTAATEVVFTGTHTGPLVTPVGELPPTRRRVQTRSASMLRFRDGMVIAEHVYSDQLDMMTQLGLGPGGTAS